MIRDMITLDSFVVGRALPPNASTYIKRAADDELFSLAQAGQLAFVLAPKQLGKSSLMIHTAQRLREQGVRSALLYLNDIDTRAGAEKWFLALLARLKLQLKLPIEPEVWWQEQTSPDPGTRFADFLHKVVLTEIKQPVAIFIDEVEVALNLKFADGFFAAIRSIYDARATDPDAERLTFILLGMAGRNELIKADRSLFEIGQVVQLAEFSRAEVDVLEEHMETVCANQGQAIIDRIFYWTHGHPYLTQNLCLNIVDLHENDGWMGTDSDHRIDWLVEKQFLANFQTEPNLQFIREQIDFSSRRRNLVNLYRQVYVGQRVAEDESSLDQNTLKLWGLVRPERDRLMISNQIYRRVFNLDWIKAATSLNRTLVRMLAAAVILIVLVLAGGLGYYFYQQRMAMIASQAGIYTTDFRNATTPEDRLISLAGLFSLGLDEEGRQLFYNQLDPAEQLEIFEAVNMVDREEELITIVEGLYTSRYLENNDEHNALLESMAHDLRTIDYSVWLRAVDLELEITNWLKGRDFYKQTQYRQAIDALDIAIELNDRNLGTRLDRSLAYAALDDPAAGLNELESIIDWDERWTARVQQALLSDPNLYNGLWIDQSGQETLIALVPTPTSTPTPTPSPTPSPTPIPTDTPEIRRPTTTPTPTAPPTATPRPVTSVSTSVAPPTPGLPAGTFVLIGPTNINDPTYGPTKFEWEWAGAVPSNYGFEVRVWSEGKAPAGVHNAVLDNQSGFIEYLGGSRYSFATDITEAAGIKGQSGVYLWTVALVQISPEYADLGQQATPAQLRFEARRSGGSSGGGSDGGGGGGGVGIN